MLQSYVRTFKLYEVDAVFRAAVAAAESLGHTVVDADSKAARIELRTGKSAATRAKKKMIVTVTRHPQGHTVGMVHGPVFFAQKRPIRFGEELFKAMDVILAS